MNNTPTPRTDANILWAYDDCQQSFSYCSPDFARRLERELSEQCTLLGKSAEREADLLGKVERLERENAELARKVAEGEALTGEAYFADRDLFMRYVADHVQPARLKEGLAVLSERSCEVSYDIITSRRYRTARAATKEDAT